MTFAIVGATVVGLTVIAQLIEYFIHRNSHGGHHHHHHHSHNDHGAAEDSSEEITIHHHQEEEHDDIEKCYHSHGLAEHAVTPDALTHCCEHDHHDHDHHDHSHPPTLQKAGAGGGGGPEHCCDVGALEGMSEWAALSLFLAMCVHAVLEGMMLGTTRTKKKLLMAFGALAMHKGFEAFAVGASLLETKMSRRKFIVYSLLFTMASPLGALIGFFVTGSQDAAHTKTAGIINAISAGTFLQVACMEMIPRSFKNPTWRVGKLLALTLGFSLVCYLAQKFPHEH